MKENGTNAANYHPYHLNFDEETTKNYIHHQSKIVVEQALEMLEHIDEVHGSIRAMASNCHRMLKHHASIVEYFEKNNSILRYGEEEEEEEMEVSEKKEGEKKLEEDEQIKMGDIVYCVSGRELGGMQGCTVVEVSPSKKTFVLLDHRGRQFRKYKKCIKKIWTTSK